MLSPSLHSEIVFEVEGRSIAVRKAYLTNHNEFFRVFLEADPSCERISTRPVQSRKAALSVCTDVHNTLLGHSAAPQRD